VKLLLDMNLPPRWAQLLSAAGHDAVHWSDIGPGRATDADIMARALNEGRVVVTHDLDFGAILAATQASGPSVVQIRADDLISGQTFDRILAALRQAETDLMAGALVTVDIQRTRLRTLPLVR
jgi:predicted nuclease of predicted toxin-antitoxin system